MTGGTVIFPAPPADGTHIDIFRQVTLSRVIDYQPTARIDPEDLNTDFNFLLAALRDVRQIDVDLAQWQNTHDNVKDFLEYTNRAAGAYWGYITIWCRYWPGHCHC